MSNAARGYEELGPEQILAAVEAAGLRCDGHFLALNSYENRVYRLGLEDGGTIVAKFYRPGRWSDAAIIEEHEFALDLAEAEVPVVAPLDVDGETLLHHAGYRFAVYPCQGGRAPDLDDWPMLRQAGRLVARIHNEGRRAPFAERFRLDIDYYGVASRDYLLGEGFIPADLEPAYRSLAGDLLEATRACYERAGAVRLLRIHGDFHPGNVLLHGEALHIVDLDDTCTGPAVQDLWMFLSGDRDEQTPQLAELLAGYQEFADFDPAELNLVEALRTLRIMHYAAWLARRHEDPAFVRAFPWFNTGRYWDEHVLALREQLALMAEPPLAWIEADGAHR